MLLAVDVGNTNTVFAVYRGNEQVGQWRLSTNRDRTAEEYAATLLQLMAFAGCRREEIEAVVIASVVPQAVMPLRWMSRDYFACRAWVVGEDLAYPIPIRLPHPEEVGADRVVNAIGALTRYAPPLVIVDFGTATTFDVVDADGAYCGGAIAPGINLSLEALHRAAARLPRIAVAPPERTIGTRTVEAMQSGIFWGYIGLVEGLVARIRAELGVQATTIATGGLAPLFARRTEALEHVDPDLTMAGLLEIYKRHRGLIEDSTGGRA
ncbi:Type III pantothenate kinase [bacterium HR40]|nr:Type III pantothenate kinase [bacterium HR40]